MKKYTFHVTGASPYGGEVIVIAKTYKTAKRLADEEIHSYNVHTNYRKIRLVNDEPDRVPFSPPCVVNFVSGES